MKALFLNCSLKRSPEPSHTEALMRTSADIFEKENIDTEFIRIGDHNIPAAMEAKVDDSDEWPGIFEKVLDSRILIVGTPIWLGEKSSLATKVIERLYASSSDTNDAGQYIYYNRVAGVVATGNEDGGKAVSRSVLYGLQHIGYTIPPQADAYWVGEAGPGPSYMDAGTDNEFTKRNIRIMTFNLVHFARALAKKPIPAQGNTIDDSSG